MKDVAERAGVSVATVSNVITGKRNVSSKAQQAVLDAIHEMDYHMNMVARSLKTQRTNTIGIILPDVTKLFFNDVLKGIMQASGLHNYSISIYNSNYDFEEEKRLIATLRSLHVDGIILDSCVEYQKLDDWGGEILHLLPDSIPVVSLENDFQEKKISSVSIDSQYWSAQITQHLIDQGRKHIFFVSGPLSLTHEYKRFLGYKQALISNGLSFSEELVTYQDFLSVSSYDAVQEAIANGLEFDAIQASNDQAAIGAIKALKEVGIKVPEDVAVTGFDDIFPSTLITPSITTVQIPRYQLGYDATVECIKRIHDQTYVPRHITLKCKTIIRNSTVPSLETDWNLDNW